MNTAILNLIFIIMFLNMAVAPPTPYAPVNVNLTSGSCCVNGCSFGPGPSGSFYTYPEYVCGTNSTLMFNGSGLIQMYDCNGSYTIEGSWPTVEYGITGDCPISVTFRMTTKVATCQVIVLNMENCSEVGEMGVYLCGELPSTAAVTSTTTLVIGTESQVDDSSSSDGFVTTVAASASSALIALSLAIACFKAYMMYRSKRVEKEGNQAKAMAQLLSAMMTGTVTARDRAYEMMDTALPKYFSYTPIRSPAERDNRKRVDLKDKSKYTSISNTPESLDILYSMDPGSISRSKETFYASHHRLAEYVKEGINVNTNQLKQIGRGSFGTVYKATPRAIWPEVDEELVIKDTEGNLPSLFSTARSLALGARLAGNEYVICPFAIDFKTKLAIMPYADMFRSLENFSTEEVRWYINHGIREFCTAVSVIHMRGIYHGDINPTNVGLCYTTQGRKIVLLDFDNGRLKETKLDEAQIPIKYMTRAIIDYNQAPSASFDNFCVLVNTCVLIASLYDAPNNETSIRFHCKVNWSEAWEDEQVMEEDPFPVVLYHKYSIIDSGIPDDSLLEFGEYVRNNAARIESELYKYFLWIVISKDYFRSSDYLHKSKISFSTKLKELAEV